MIDRFVFRHLRGLSRKSHTIPISRQDRVVIFSDIHFGDGSDNDDFAQNGPLFHYVLENHYLPGNYRLILNGDIEELHKFSLKKIIARWRPAYRLFEQFHQQHRLTKLIGNHDYDLSFKKRKPLGIPIIDACTLDFNGNRIFVFHGHQASPFYRVFQPLSSLVVRYLANPLGIKNYSVAFNSVKRYKLEKRIYDFARQEKMLVMIGHTHRPLFESQSRIDTLKARIDKLCRLYPRVGPHKQKEIELRIKEYLGELQKLLLKKRKKRYMESLYSEDPIIPCLFNSGCCIGKKGITAIEITGGEIELVYWIDQKRPSKYFARKDHLPIQLNNSDYWRVSLKKESLDYIITRLKLLS